MANIRFNISTEVKTAMCQYKIHNSKYYLAYNNVITSSIHVHEKQHNAGQRKRQEKSSSLCKQYDKRYSWFIQKTILQHVTKQTRRIQIQSFSTSENKHMAVVCFACVMWLYTSDIYKHTTHAKHNSKIRHKTNTEHIQTHTTHVTQHKTNTWRIRNTILQHVTK